MTTCATSTRKFNESASKLNNTVVLVISNDLPFPARNFCVNEGLENITTLSVTRGPEFMRNYGVEIANTGVAARAVVVLDESNKVIYTELISEITEAPNYDAALAALK